MAENGAPSLGPGTYGIPAELYHSDPCERPSLSSSIAHVICRDSPRHAWYAHPRLNPNLRREEADHFDLGTAAHALLLQGEKVVHVVEANDWRTKEAKDARASARARGLIPLLPPQWEQVQAMVAAVRDQLPALELDPLALVAGKPEQTLIWEERGVLCRALVDWLHDDRSAIDDLKTTGRSAHPADWTRRTLWAIGADIQVAFYLRGMRAVFGAEPVWRYIVVECSPPYAVSVISLAPSALELANEKVDYALDTWGRCLKTGEWRAYPPHVASAEAPDWAIHDWMERGVEELTA